MNSVPPGKEKNLAVEIRKSFPGQGGPTFALDVKFTVSNGFTILFGASGSGKTTVLDCIAGLQTPHGGRIVAGGEIFFESASATNIPPHRRRAGYLLQSLALFPHLTASQNVQYGLAALPASERESRSREILEAFRVSALSPRYPSEISGGERQRVALARTLVTRPRVLLLDEPLTALDAVTKALIIDDLRAWNQHQQIPILYVTHAREEVFALGEQVIVVEAGQIVAQGSPHDVLQHAQAETVAQLAGFENIFKCAALSAHVQEGTMTCRLADSSVEIEVPLARLNADRPPRVGIRAGDILVATTEPRGLSARNVLAGVLQSLQLRDSTMVARVDCGAMFEVHLTRTAVSSLHLQPSSPVWLVIKTYSCHLLQ